jgi:hypothetical protein
MLIFVGLNFKGEDMQSIINFIMGNKAAIALAVYAILDLAILVNPKLEANGILHQIQLWASSLSGQAPPPSVPPPSVPPAS